MNKTPVLFIIFNRPDKTQRVLEGIKLYQPNRLYIAADGPRQRVASDIENCKQTREIIKAIDWPCEVKTLFREENLGCDVSIPDAIHWFFEHETSGIILEDDCLPNLDFFEFSNLLLEKYADDEKVMHISGSNFFKGKLMLPQSYFFSNIPLCWGWATWKRAWKSFDYDLIYKVDESWPDKILLNRIYHSYQRNILKSMLGYHIDKKALNWDYRWIFSIWNANGIAINPSKNFINNIGLGADATHFTGDNHSRNVLADMPLESINKIIHPKTIEINKAAEILLQEILFPAHSKIKLLKHQLGKLIPAQLKSLIRKS